MAGVAGRSGGRNIKSVASHRLAGTFQPVRHGHHANPMVKRGRPEPPKPLDGDALNEWTAVCYELDAADVLATTDRMAMYQYCRLYADTEALSVLQEETGGSIDRLEENLSGLDGAELVQCFQEITKLRQLEARYVVQIRQGRMGILRFLVEFGHTPSARARVKLPVGSTPDGDEVALGKLLAIK